LYTDDTDDTEKPLKIRSFSVFSVKSVYQKGLITAIPNEPILFKRKDARAQRFFSASLLLGVKDSRIYKIFP
jgi:hypothetical protein